MLFLIDAGKTRLYSDTQNTYAPVLIKEKKCSLGIKRRRTLLKEMSLVELR